MPTYSRVLLSASTNGKNVAVAGTTITSTTTIHTALTGTTGFDEVYAWASNISSAAATLSLCFGNTTSADHICSSLSLPANSPPIPIITGQVLQNSLIVSAYSGTANAINLSGFANRIS